MSDAHDFKLLRFNPRRARRGVWAAEVCCSFDGLGDDVLWMDEKAIKLNIKEFGPHPELLKALEHYRTWREFPEREAVAKGKFDRDWLNVPRFNDAYEFLPLDVRVAVAHDDFEFADLMLNSFVTPQLLQLKHLAMDVLRKADWQ